MNKLATELNNQLEGTIAHALLSEVGKRFYFPKGIITQSAEAKQSAEINATIGMSYLDKSAMVLPTLKQYLTNMSNNQMVAYAPTTGIPELRELWKRQIHKKNPDLGSAEISTPLVVSGLTNGIAQIAEMFLDPGDITVMPDMFWGNYRLILEEKKQATLVHFPLFTHSGALNISGLKEAVTRSTKNSGQKKVILLINFPNNPSGYSATRQEAEELKSALVELADNGLQLLVITDDAYFGLFYEEETYKQSIFAKLAGAHDNILAVKVDGATKEDFAWGLRVGFVTFGSKNLNTVHYEALNKKLGGLVRASISSSSGLSQNLLINLIKSPSYQREKRDSFLLLEKRYKKAREILGERAMGKDLTSLPFNSGYFMCFERAQGGTEELRKKLLHEHKIGTISIQDKYLRVAFSAVNLEELEGLYAAIFQASDQLD